MATSQEMLQRAAEQAARYEGSIANQKASIDRLLEKIRELEAHVSAHHAELHDVIDAYACDFTGLNDDNEESK